MPGVFISYRRGDSAGHAGRVFDLLKAHFGSDQVFMDVDTIKPGQDFAKVIGERVANCDVLIALIGKDWQQARTPTGQLRLNDPNDFVRQEIGSALSRGLAVIPVLVERASMPDASSLPADIARMARLQALVLTDERFAEDVNELVDSIERYSVSPIAPTIAGQTRPYRWKVASTVLFGTGLLLGLVWMNHSRTTSNPTTEVTQAKNPSGIWTAQVPIRNGGHYTLTLRLELVNDSMLGSVDFPTGSGGIHDGHLRQDQISFSTVHRPQFSEADVTTRFEGQMVGNELDLVMQYDDVVQRFRAKRKQGL